MAEDIKTEITRDNSSLAKVADCEQKRELAIKIQANSDRVNMILAKIDNSAQGRLIRINGIVRKLGATTRRLITF